MAKEETIADTYPLVVIMWWDHCSLTGWRDIEEIKEWDLGLVASVGWLIHEEKEYYVLSSMISDDMVQHGVTQIIGKGMILDKKILFGKINGSKKWS